MQIKRLDSLFAYVPIFIVSAGVALYGCNPQYMICSRDAVVYHYVAEFISHGKGFFHPNLDGTIIPLEHYPPFYSILLAALMKTFTISSVSAAVVISTLGYATTVTLGAITAENIYKTRKSALLFAFLCLTASSFYKIFFIMLSESLFFPLVFLSILLLSRYMSYGGRVNFITAALVTSVIPVTRYVGVSLLAAQSLLLLFYPKNYSFKSRLLSSSAYGITTSLPLAVWYIHILQTGTGRAFKESSLFLDRAKDTISTLYYYIFPFAAPFSMMCLTALLVLLFIITTFVWKRNQLNHFLNIPTYHLWATFGGIYLALILLMTFLTGEPWPFDARILLPLQIVWLLTFSGAFFVLIDVTSMKAIRFILIGGLVCFLTLTSFRGIVSLWRLHGSSRKPFSYIKVDVKSFRPSVTPQEQRIIYYP